MHRHVRAFVVPVLAACALAGCVVEKGGDTSAADTTAAAAPRASQTAVAPAGTGTPADTAAPSRPDTQPDTVAGATSPAARPVTDVRVEVDVDARRLTVYRGQTQTASYPVAVGSAEWPTRPGEWTITQVVWNPEWVPPDETWAEQRERRAPGDPRNPLGRAQLVYDLPRTIHGTNEPASIGKAVSHGSIRLSNADVTRLGRALMEAAGAGRDEAWYRSVAANRTEKQVVDLPRVVPIRVF